MGLLTPAGIGSSAPLCFALGLIVIAASGCQSTGRAPTALSDKVPPDWQIRLHQDEGPWVASGVAPATVTSTDSMTIYIEGDGNAWITRAMPSSDPTPAKPVALDLAIGHTAPSRRAYLGRPCQFDARAWPGCEPLLWTQDRYSQTVAQAMSDAIDTLQESTADTLVLVGYSGGGVIAALLAAKRDDVAGFVTVASNLDTAFWTDLHKVTPLTGSDTPLNYAEKLSQVPQFHIAGARDKSVPPSVVESYLKKLGLPMDRHLKVEESFDHHCCWARAWPRLYDESLSRLRSQTSDEGLNTL